MEKENFLRRKDHIKKRIYLNNEIQEKDQAYYKNPIILKQNRLQTKIIPQYKIDHIFSKKRKKISDHSKWICVFSAQDSDLDFGF